MSTRSRRISPPSSALKPLKVMSPYMSSAPVNNACTRSFSLKPDTFQVGAATTFKEYTLRGPSVNFDVSRKSVNLQRL